VAGSGASGNGGSDGGRGFRRRELLVYGGAATAAGALSQLESSWKPLEELLRGSGSGNLTATMLRADDFLALEFEFLNLHLTGSGEGTRLERTDLNKRAFVVVRFEPQAIAEETFWEKSDTDGTDTPGNPDDPTDPGGDEPPKSPGTLGARLAGDSRLAFVVPSAIDSIPFNDASLLRWERWVQSVVPAALPPISRSSGVPSPKPKPEQPSASETAIEVPWQVILSPHKRSAWAHSSQPVSSDGRTELWHTRLAVRTKDGAVDEQKSGERTVRAVWTPGFNRNQAPDPSQLGPFRMPLTPRDRWELVELTSDFALPSPNPTPQARYYVPKPVNVDHLMLSSLGAWINSRGDWDKAPNKLNIVHWTQRGTMAREHYVKVVKRGFLFPLCHRAALIQISERKIQKPGEDGDYAAYLRKRAFIVVKEPVKSHKDRDMPLRSVRIRTVVTPDLDAYDGAQAGDTKVLKPPPSNQTNFYGEAAFWPRVGGEDFLFNIAASDFDGKTIEFSAPLIFVLHSTGTNTDNPGDTENICARYEADNELATERRTRPLQGQRLAYAKPDKPGDTSLETENLVLGCEIPEPGTVPKDDCQFRPRMMKADVRLSAVEAVKGPLEVTAVEHHQAYLDHGIDSDQNKSRSYLRTESSGGVPLNYGTDAEGDRCGGIGAPNMTITGISRSLGPTGGPPNAAPPKFDPTSFLSGAKFLGINFADVLVKDLPTDGSLAKLPKTVSETVFPGGDPAKPATEILTRMDWQPALKKDPLEVFEPKGPGGDAAMLLRALYRTPLNPPGEPDFEVSGDLRSFRLHLFGSAHEFLVLHFNTLAFQSRKGQKPKVDVDISDVTFSGPLKFVNELRQYLRSNGNGFDVVVAPQQVSAGYTLTIPDAPFGVITIKNIGFTAGVTIPFTGQAVTARFAFSEKEKPFLVSYTIFGGGGYFEINIGAHGIESFAAALEFGASAEIDLGPASGGVEIMAGVYLAIAEDDAELTGYVRLHGELDVLGLISVSLSFYLGMTYDFGADELWGQCTLTVEVEVLVFSGSVEVTAEKRFAGGGGGGPGKAKALTKGFGGGQGPAPIRFEDLLTEDEWQDVYVTSFAAEAFA
jgi:hypothetical protein